MLTPPLGDTTLTGLGAGGGTERFAALGRGRGGHPRVPLALQSPAVGAIPVSTASPMVLLCPQGVPKPLGGRDWGGKLSTGVTTTPKTPLRSPPHAPTLPQIPPGPIQPRAPFPNQPRGGGVLALGGFQPRFGVWFRIPRGTKPHPGRVKGPVLGAKNTPNLTPGMGERCPRTPLRWGGCAHVWGTGTPGRCEKGSRSPCFG